MPNEGTRSRGARARRVRACRTDCRRGRAHHGYTAHCHYRQIQSPSATTSRQPAAGSGEKTRVDGSRVCSAATSWCEAPPPPQRRQGLRSEGSAGPEALAGRLDRQCRNSGWVGVGVGGTQHAPFLTGALRGAMQGPHGTCQQAAGGGARERGCRRPAGWLARPGGARGAARQAPEGGVQRREAAGAVRGCLGGRPMSRSSACEEGGTREHRGGRPCAAAAPGRRQMRGPGTAAKTGACRKRGAARGALRRCESGDPGARGQGGGGDARPRPGQAGARPCFVPLKTGGRASWWWKGGARASGAREGKGPRVRGAAAGGVPCELAARGRGAAPDASHKAPRGRLAPRARRPAAQGWWR